MLKGNVKAIVFGFDEVFGTFDLVGFVAELAERTKHEPPEVVRALRDKHGRKESLLVRFRRGSIGPSEFYRELMDMLQGSEYITIDEFATLWENWFAENTGLDQLLTTIPCRKFLLANTERLSVTRHIATAGIIRRHIPNVKDRVYSYIESMLVPEPKIFEVIIKRTGMRPEEILLIDSVHAHVQVWTSLGGMGIVYSMHNTPINSLKEKIEKMIFSD